MTSHLSAAEIAYYLRGSLRDAELLRVDEHLDECEACRAELDAWEQVGPASPAPAGGRQRPRKHLWSAKIATLVRAIARRTRGT